MTTAPKSKSKGKARAKKQTRAREASPKFPFIYIGHGVAAARKTMSCLICFRDVVPKEARKSAQKKAPNALSGYFDWTNDTLQFGHDSDSLQWVVAAEYPDGGPRAAHGAATDAQWRHFNDELDAWLLTLHAKYPIAFFYKPIDDEYSTATDDVHAWSMKLAPTHVWPVAAARGDALTSWLEQMIDLWKWEISQRPLDEQKSILKSLQPETRAILKAHGGVPKATPLPTFDPTPTLDEARAVWNELRPMAANGVDIHSLFNDRYAHLKVEGVVSRYDLWTFALTLKSAGDLPGAIDVADIGARTRSTRTPSLWWPFFAELLIEAGRLEEAVEPLRQTCLRLQTYQGGLSALIDYYKAKGDRESARIVYFAALHCTTSPPEGGRYGAPPKDWRERFSTILDSWVAQVWDPSKMPLDQIYRVSRYAEDFGGEALKARGAEAARLFRERRDRMKEIVNAAPNMSTEETLDALGKWPIALEADAVVQDLFRLAHLFASRGDRLAAIALYERQVCSRREVWLGGGVLEGFNNLLILYHQAGQLDRAMHLMPDALRVAPENLAIYHAAACIFAARGDWDGALALVVEAKERNYPHMDKIAQDEDLAPLRERPEFVSLFS